MVAVVACHSGPPTGPQLADARVDTPDARADAPAAPDAVSDATSDAIMVDAGPPEIAAIAIAAGQRHGCALVDGGVRCWGDGTFGRLGGGDTNDVGDDETAGCAATLALGGPVVQVAGGRMHSCALRGDGAVYCWGDNRFGQLGHPGVDALGDDEAAGVAGPVALGGPAAQISASSDHTCAVMTTGELRCWGRNLFGALGYGHTEDIGDDEPPTAAGFVDVGGAVSQVAAGGQHTCALLTTGGVRCWGRAVYGQLGYGNTKSIGDDESPASAGDVAVGGATTRIAAGADHTCAILATGAIRCWGEGNHGQLGYANTDRIGDDETPASAGSVVVGGAVSDIALGQRHTCAVTLGGGVRCWGARSSTLGYPGVTEDIGDDETPASAGDVPFGPGLAAAVATGTGFSMALLESGALRCWGDGAACGFGRVDTIGDDEPPSAAGDVPLGSCEWPVECADPIGPACTADPYEPNDDIASPTLLAGAIHDGFLCAGDEDWYLVPGPSGATSMQYQVLLVHESLSFVCDICSADELLPSCPSYTVSVDVHDAATGALLATQTRARGYLLLDRLGVSPGDLLIRIYGTPATSTPYRLRVVSETHDPDCDNVDCALPEVCDGC